MTYRSSSTAFAGLLLCSSLWSQTLSPDPNQPVIPPVPGVLQNTMTAQKLSVGEKFQYRVIQQFGWRGFLGAALGGTILQGTNTPKEWGQGWGAFGERYGSSFGSALADQAFTFGLEAALHEDPRYFPSTEKGFGKRLRNVVKQTFLSKKDDGRATFAYARFGGDFASAFLTNSWQPASNNSVGDALVRGFLNVASDGGFYLVQEFIPFSRNSRFRHHP